MTIAQVGGHHPHADEEPVALHWAVVTISDSRTPHDDDSGDLLVNRLTQAGHQELEQLIIPDDIDEIRGTVESGKLYPVDEALSLIKQLSKTKFKESVDVSVNLGVDPRKSDQVVRGSTVLPNGTGKDVRVAVFAQGANADAAKEAGADKIGMEDLAEEVKKGNLDFDV
jgi:hypothetical protein